jgi:hypothetical protein
MNIQTYQELLNSISIHMDLLREHDPFLQEQFKENAFNEVTISETDIVISTDERFRGETETFRLWLTPSEVFCGSY